MSSLRPPIALRPFTGEALDTVAPWFDDAETFRWLGGREWPAQLLTLLADSPREHRGSVVRERAAWVGSSEGADVALVDAEIYTDGSAAVSLVVAPERRRRGLGTATLVAVGAFLARSRGITRLIGGVEHTNTISARCAVAAGFFPLANAPDDEGFIDFELRLAQPTAR